MNTELMENRKENIFIMLLMGIAGVAFITVGVLSGLLGQGTGMAEGIIPMIFGVAFLLVTGIYRFNSKAAE